MQWTPQQGAETHGRNTTLEPFLTLRHIQNMSKGQNVRNERCSPEFSTRSRWLRHFSGSKMIDDLVLPLLRRANISVPERYRSFFQERGSAATLHAPVFPLGIQYLYGKVGEDF
jgi:hypothetical protein